MTTAVKHQISGIRASGGKPGGGGEAIPFS